MQHPTAGSPEDWLSESRLSPYRLRSVTFDFFVDWSTDRLAPAIWIKRVVTEPVSDWHGASSHDVCDALERCDGRGVLTELAVLGAKYGIPVTFKLFDDSTHWDPSASRIMSASLDVRGTVSAVRVDRLDVVQQTVRALSGGPVRIGEKGLYWGTSSLECYLSRTDSAWPGDVDSVLLRDGEPIALLEFKKHTKPRMEQRIEDQSLGMYYPRPDGRKYDRLAILRDYLGVELPLIVIYYPTRTDQPFLVLERLRGAPRALEVVSHIKVRLPQAATDDAGVDRVLRGLIWVITGETLATPTTRSSGS